MALFIWFAENIGTFTAAWIYPNQRHGWTLVSFGKLGAWYLLMIISYVLVALVNRPQAMPSAQADRKDQAPELRLGVQSAPRIVIGMLIAFELGDRCRAAVLGRRLAGHG